LSDPYHVFFWSAGAATHYHICAGTAVGGCDLLSKNTGSSRSVTVRNLPTDGRSIYVRLWGLVGGTWQYSDHAYVACSGCAVPRITSPGSFAISRPSATVFWSEGNAAQYHLYVGTTGLGSRNLYDLNTSTRQSAVLCNLPATGPVYVRLWGLVNGVWRSRDYIYQ
jgi:hypothetical protein